ncbi:hypothetical protein CaCOL14_005048 [Colletotrichum acutatum]
MPKVIASSADQHEPGRMMWTTNWMFIVVTKNQMMYFCHPEAIRSSVTAKEVFVKAKEILWQLSAQYNTVLMVGVTP